MMGDEFAFNLEGFMPDPIERKLKAQRERHLFVSLADALAFGAHQARRHVGERVVSVARVGDFYQITIR